MRQTQTQSTDSKTLDNRNVSEVKKQVSDVKVFGTTQQDDNVAESICLVPRCKIGEDKNGNPTLKIS